MVYLRIDSHIRVRFLTVSAERFTLGIFHGVTSDSLATHRACSHIVFCHINANRTLDMI